MRPTKSMLPKPPRSESSSRLRRVAVGLIVAAIAGVVSVLAILKWKVEPSRTESLFAKQGGERPSAVPTDGYIGSESCRECHKDEHRTWSSSYHRTMTQVATEHSILGNFDGVELETQGEQFRLERDDDGFWVEIPDPSKDDGTPAEPTGERRRVVLSTGSHHMQVYWFSSGRGSELVALPFVWLIEEKRWIPRLSAFLTPPFEMLAPTGETTLEILLEKGRWNQSCIHCHTTHGKPRMENPPRTTVAEFGISCEACHGPGEPHVLLHREQPDPTRPDPIINPVELPIARSSEVCGQCHSIHRAASMEQFTEIDRSGKPFRPGDCLGDLYDFDTDKNAPGYAWSDGMVRVTGREYSALEKSPCFLRGEATCFSCHEMHPSENDTRPLRDWADDQLRPHLRGNEACLQCHQEYREERILTSHTHHLTGSHGSECMNCHMPNTVYGLLKATRSHQVSSPSVRETMEIGRPNACNLCHLDKTLTWASRQLAEWYGQDSLPESDTGHIAASALMALRGDAGARALAAWHMGWGPARAASGEAWMPPYLSKLMEDDYDAVRFIAERSLRSLPGHADLDYDFMSGDPERRRVAEWIGSRWKETAHPDDPALLISDGEMEPLFNYLLEQRNERVINLLE